MKNKKVYRFIKALRKVPHSNKKKDLSKYYAMLNEKVSNKKKDSN